MSVVEAMTDAVISMLQSIEGVARIILGMALLFAIVGAFIGTVFGLLMALLAMATGNLPK